MTEPAEPRFRVTIRSGQVFLTEWAASLASGGLLGTRPEEREGGVEAAIADLTPLGEDDTELVVELHVAGPDSGEAERTLVKWASHVGYRRVWLSSEIVEIPPSPAQIGVAAVRCPTCASVWREASPEFWLGVRERKLFPLWCAICGSEMPQWDVLDSLPGIAGTEKERPDTGSSGKA